MSKLDMTMTAINKQSTLYFALVLAFVILLVNSCTEPDIEAPQQENYIAEVFDYQYAPGQHAALAKSSDIKFFKGDPAAHQGFVYLGGFGGYIVAGFEQDIENRAGPDFEVFALKGASPEPAIVYVMSDDNKDGKPNDRWYELKGSEYANSKRSYWLRYYKPDGENTHIMWLDSEGKSGELVPGYGSEFSAAWWWKEMTADSVTYSGTRLPDAYENIGSNDNEMWVVPANKFLWGYAENNSGEDYNPVLGTNKFDISNAVDEHGHAVELTSIRFIKVQTAVFQQAGWTNEVSAELRGARETQDWHK